MDISCCVNITRAEYLDLCLYTKWLIVFKMLLNITKLKKKIILCKTNLRKSIIFSSILLLQKLPQAKQPTLGSLVAAQFEDGWYRAKVLSVGRSTVSKHLQICLKWSFSTIILFTKLYLSIYWTQLPICGILTWSEGPPPNYDNIVLMSFKDNKNSAVFSTIL